MTTLAEKIAVMQAFERGEKVEDKHKGGGTWAECGSPTWDWFLFEYRIAPKKIDLVEVLEALRLNIEGEQQSLAKAAGHAWAAIIERAKELQGLAVTACEPPAAPKVKVKKLVWDNSSEGWIFARADKDEYRIAVFDGRYSMVTPMGGAFTFDTLSDAKFAAQCDFEARILEALEV